MKKIIILFIIIVSAYLGYNNSQNKEVKFNLTDKYNYKALSKNTLDYLRNDKFGNIYSKRTPSKKMFIYYDFIDVSCPYRKYFQSLMEKYKNEPAWTQKYDFYGVRTTERFSIDIVMGSKEDKEFRSYADDCGSSFCIVDFEKNLIFVPDKKAIYTSPDQTYNYVYDVLSTFYNK